MQLENQFALDVPIAQAWAALINAEVIIPCMPGAVLTTVDGDSFTGVLKLKIGPIQTQFKGQATYTELDHQAHRAVLKARARDTTGKGNADALITMQLTGNESGTTHCSVTTDLAISGKVAQFGRGAMTDIGSRLIEQFSSRLQETISVVPRVAEAVDITTGADPSTPAPTTATALGADVEPINLRSIIPLPNAWPAIAVGLTVLTFGLFWLLLGRRSS